MNLHVKPALCHIDRISHKCHVAQMSRYQNITRHKKSYVLRISHCVKNVTSRWQSCFTESVAQMSLCQKCHTCCKYVLSSTLSRDANVFQILNINNLLYKPNPIFKKPNVSGMPKISIQRPDPSDGKCQGGRPHQWKMSGGWTPPMENVRPLRWKMSVHIKCVDPYDGKWHSDS